MIGTKSSGGAPRGPGLVYLGLTVALLVLVSTVALTARQAAPPTVAEFAPEALEQIKEAPQEQSSEFGSSDGGAGGGAAETSTTTTPGQVSTTTTALPVEVPRVNRCVGEPPRQIEDPQSPPCIPFWEGDNGGATARGVTSETVTVVIPTVNSGDAGRMYAALEKFFNARFEFYGRKLKFVYPRQSAGSGDPAEQKAHARDDFERYQPFASASYFNALGYWYQQEMGRLGVTYASAAGTYSNLAPTVYTYLMEADEMVAATGEWMCARLAGRPAAHAGDPGLQVRERVFGIIQQTAEEDTTSPAPMVDELARCGVTPAVVARNEIALNGGDPTTATSVVARMREAGVTSIVCLCHLFNYGVVQSAASNQLFHPEWLTTSYGGLDFNAFIKLGGSPPDQMANAFGLTFQPRQVPYTDEPFWWAVRETDPSFQLSADESAVVGAGFAAYRPLLLLASGIQMAGPNLTPETFREGLAKARFPNPPYYTMPGAVGFAGGRQGMTLDAAELWWSNTAPSPYVGDGRGSYCYVGGGVRHGRGQWPDDDDPFFQPDTACSPTVG